MPRKSRQLEAEHLSRPLVVVHGPAEDEHRVADDGGRVEQAATGYLRIGQNFDELPGLRVEAEAVHGVGQDVVGRAAEDVEMAVERHLKS